MVKDLFIILVLVALFGVQGSALAQYLPPAKPKPVGPVNSTVTTGLATMPTEKELTAMVHKVLLLPDHKELVKLIKTHHITPKPFPTCYTWDLVRTRGWTTKEPYIRAYAMQGQNIALVVAVPIKVVDKKLQIDNERQLHGCVPIDCPVCILHFNTDSLLLGCATWGVNDQWYKDHPAARCEHYLRKPFGETIFKKFPKDWEKRIPKPKNKAQNKNELKSK